MSEKKMMSKRKSIVASVMVMLLMFITMFVGNMQAQAAVFQLSKSSWSVGAGGGSTTVTVNSSHEWSVQSKPSWVSASGSGYTLSLSVGSNPSTSSRTGSVVLYSIGDTRTITVTQSGKAVEEVFQLSKSSWTAGAGQDSTTVTVTSSREWSIKSKPSWVSASKSGSTLSLSVMTNMDSTSRTGSVVLESGGNTKTITVTQSGNEIKVGSVPTLSASGASQTVSVTTGVGFTLGTPTESWLKVQKSGNSVILSADMNSGLARSTTFTINSGNLHQDVTVTQAANSVKLNKTEWTSEAIGESETISVTTGIGTFSVDSNKDWVKVAKNGSSVTITTEKYTYPDDRTATVTIRSGNMFGTIAVTQKGNKITVSKESWNLKALPDPDTETISVTTGINTFNVSSNQKWLKVSKNGDSITASVTINSSPFPRKGVITITSGNTKKEIPVEQAGNTIEVSQDKWHINAKLNTKIIEVKAGIKTFSVSSNCDWITVSKDNGYTFIFIKAQPNPTEEVREGIVTIRSGDAYKTIYVNQSKNILNVAESCTVEACKDSEAVVKVDAANGKFDVSTNTTWLSVSKEDGAVKITTKEANTSRYQREGWVTVTSGDITKKITVTQKGNSLTVGANRYSAHAVGGKLYTTVKVASGHEFYVYCSEDWFTATVDGNSLCIEVNPNLYYENRTGKVTITSCGMFESINISQDKNFYSNYSSKLKLYPKEIYLSNEAQSVEVSVFSPSDKWMNGEIMCAWGTGDTNPHATVEKNWLTVSKAPDKLIIDVTEKTTSVERIGYIYITIDGVSEQIIVHQGVDKIINVTLDSCGHGNLEYNSFTIVNGENYPYDWLPCLVEKGYLFLGWYYVDENNNTVKVGSDTKCVNTGDHKLYAEWAKVDELVEKGSYVGDEIGISGADIILGLNDGDKQWLLEYYEARYEEEKKALDDYLELLYKDGSYEEEILNIKLMAYSSDEPYRSLFFEYIGEIDIITLNSQKPVACYNPTYKKEPDEYGIQEIGLHLKSNSDPDNIDWYITFFHETFHAIDDSMYEDGYFCTKESTDEYYKTAEAETEAWLEAEIYNAKMQVVAEKQEKNCSEAELSGVMMVDVNQMVERIMDPDYDGTFTNPYVEGTYEYQIFVKLEEIMTSDLRGSKISDTLDGYTNGLIGYGHWIKNHDYWFNEDGTPTEYQMLEFFAEYGSAIMMNDDYALSAYYEYYSETAELMNQLAEDNSQGGAN